MGIEFVLIRHADGDVKKQQKPYHLGLLVTRGLWNIGILMEVDPRSDGIHVNKEVIDIEHHKLLTGSFNCLSRRGRIAIPEILEESRYDEAVDLTARDLRIYLEYGIILDSSDRLISAILDDATENITTSQSIACNKTSTEGNVDDIDFYLKLLTFVCLSGRHPKHPQDINYNIYVDLSPKRVATMRYIIFHMDGDKIESFSTKEIPVTRKKDIEEMAANKPDRYVVPVKTTITISGKTYTKRTTYSVV